jgi:hypothetical protein
MNAVTLTNHQIWDELAKLLAPIALNHLIEKHLESCNYKIRRYWDNNKFYEEIAFIHPICAELIDRSAQISSTIIPVLTGLNLNFYSRLIYLRLKTTWLAMIATMKLAN